MMAFYCVGMPIAILALLPMSFQCMKLVIRNLNNFYNLGMQNESSI
jgi:hypothetical protein